LQSDATPAAYHSWRRQVKYAANQSLLLSDLAPVRAMTVGPRLRELASLLGHAQDLELLEELLRQQPDALGIDTHVQRLRQLISTSLVQLHHRALEVGSALFRSDDAPSRDELRVVVTERKHDGKGAAMTGREDAASLVRPVIPARDPDSSRRRQFR
jgi:hypothetical protein